MLVVGCGPIVINYVHFHSQDREWALYGAAVYHVSFCLHVSLERNINFVHEISRVKYNAFRKFSARNIFVRKRNDKNFSHELFGIEINAHENKADYSSLILLVIC